MGSCLCMGSGCLIHLSIYLSLVKQTALQPTGYHPNLAEVGKSMIYFTKEVISYCMINGLAGVNRNFIDNQSCPDINYKLTVYSHAFTIKYILSP